MKKWQKESDKNFCVRWFKQSSKVEYRRKWSMDKFKSKKIFEMIEEKKEKSWK